jgi:steroid 5-alpha reductase family enzyme
LNFEFKAWVNFNLRFEFRQKRVTFVFYLLQIYSLIMLSLWALFGLDLAINVLGWAISSALATDMIYDLVGASAHVVVVVVAWAHSEHYSLRYDIASILLVVWAVRLGGFLFSRIVGSGGDKRLSKYKTKPLLFLIPWLIQSVWVFFNVLPTLMSGQGGSSRALGLLDWVGIACWIVGFTVQVGVCCRALTLLWVHEISARSPRRLKMGALCVCSPVTLFIAGRLG